MRILLIDIETTPNLAHVWGLWDQNVGLPQLLEPTEMLCFAAKWLGEPDRRTEFHAGKHSAGPGDDGDVLQARMIERAHDLLDEADAVAHFNGRRFDVPHLNREFLLLGLEPPSPYKQIDLLETVRRTFRFPSNKLAYVNKALGIQGKVEHEGHSLWIKCMAGDRAAWKRMRQYNVGDIASLEALHHRVLPWVSSYPNHGLYDGNGKPLCPTCGGKDLVRRGMAYTRQSAFQQYRCGTCGHYSRETKRLSGVSVVDAT